MLKDIFSALPLRMQQAELCALRAEGFQRKSGMCSLKAVLQFPWVRPGTALHLILTNLCSKAAVNVTE